MSRECEEIEDDWPKMPTDIDWLQVQVRSLNKEVKSVRAQLSAVKAIADELFADGNEGVAAQLYAAAGYAPPYSTCKNCGTGVVFRATDDDVARWRHTDCFSALWTGCRLSATPGQLR